MAHLDVRAAAMTGGAASGWPPPPHDPRERAVVAASGAWEVRAFGADDPRRAYLAARGFGHLQLWHPARRVSVLTPSRLTRAHFEIFPIEGWKFPAADLTAAADVVRQVFGIPLPRRAHVTALLEWFVHATAREVARSRLHPRSRTAKKSVDNGFQNQL